MRGADAGFRAFWRAFAPLFTDEPSQATVFNQYRDADPALDLPDAAAIRKENLRNYLAGVVDTAELLVVGEAAGPWECRFSGIPFTGERQLLDPSFPLGGRRSSRDVPSRATRISPPFSSRTATIFWQTMFPYHPHFLVWNAFPLHPHQPGEVLSVRNPAAGEVSRFGPALSLLIDYLQPAGIVAVGRTADGALTRLGRAHHSVRHPSQGGKEAFRTGMERLRESRDAGGGK